MHTRRRIVSLALLCSLLAASRASSAQPTAGQRAIAETLFREGRQLMAQGRFHDACPKLAESQRIDAQVGTLINLAACHDGEGKTASAWAEYNDAAAQAVRAGRADHESVARRKGAEVQARLSRVVMIAARPIDGLVVTFDGAQLGNGVLGTPLPIDPGQHAIKAEAVGRAAWSSILDVAPGPATQTVTLPDLAPASPGSPSFPDPVAPPPRVNPLAWVSGGVALTSIGIGTYFGILAFTKNDAAAIACPHNVCDAAGIALDHQGRTVMLRPRPPGLR